MLNLDDLPPMVADALRGMDKDGDGTIDVSELHMGAQEAEKSLTKSRFFRKLFIILFGIWLAQLASTFGCGFSVLAERLRCSVLTPGPSVVFGVVNYTKESVVSKQSAQMLTKDSSAVVQTAAAVMNVPLSSNLPDEAFLELKTIGLTSATGATMHLTVLGFLRMPGMVGSVTVITHIGRIVLTGEDLSYFDDTQAALFQSAGFSVSGTSRRLLQVRALFGIFNAVAAVSRAAGGTTAPASVPPPMLPDAFIMFAQRLTPCLPVTPANGAAVPIWQGNFTGDLTPPRAAGVDLCSLLQINDTLLMHTYHADGSVDQRFLPMSYTMFRLGNTQLRVEYEHPAVPGQTLVEVIDSTNATAPLQFSYQVSSVDKGIALVPNADGALPVLVGPLAFYNSTNVTQGDLIQESMSAPFDYLGNTTLAGEDVRVWAMHLNNGTFHAFWYDTVDTQTVRRISFGDFGVLDVVSILPLTGDANDNAHLFMAPIDGLTDMGGAGGASGATVPLPVTLDPFVPYVPQYLAANANTTNTTTRRRLLVQEQPAVLPKKAPAVKEAVFTPRGYTSSVPTRYNYSPGQNDSSHGRKLNQYLGGCAATNKCPIKTTLMPGGGNYANQVVVVAIPGVCLNCVCQEVCADSRRRALPSVPCGLEHRPRQPRALHDRDERQRQPYAGAHSSAHRDHGCARHHRVQRPLRLRLHLLQPWRFRWPAGRQRRQPAVAAVVQHRVCGCRRRVRATFGVIQYAVLTSSLRNVDTTRRICSGERDPGAAMLGRQRRAILG